MCYIQTSFIHCVCLDSIDTITEEIKLNMLIFAKSVFNTFQCFSAIVFFCHCVLFKKKQLKCMHLVFEKLGIRLRLPLFINTLEGRYFVYTLNPSCSLGSQKIWFPLVDTEEMFDFVKKEWFRPFILFLKVIR